MEPIRRLLAATTGVAIAVSALATCGGTANPSTQPGAASAGWRDELTGGPDRLDVATTVAPISSIARNIGGSRIRLRGIIPDATNSHTFEPAPSDAQTLSKADLIVVNGLHLEQPTLDMAEASKRADAQVRMLGDSTITPEEWLFDFSFPQSEGDPNPHLWMNVTYAERYAELMRDWFSELDPANAGYYAANLTAYQARLSQLDGMIRRGVSSIPAENRKLLTYHDSWAYWAREYGFRVIGAVQASDFSDPSPQEVATLIDQIRAEKVPAVFGSEVFPSPVLEQIARESGARFVDALRDDEPPGEQTAPEHTYLGMLKKDMQVMTEALGGDPHIFDPLPVTDTFQP
ncbi:MAG: manganese/iron transport system substrate-binding protein [Chloroflexota bacterium]|jgi:manganese/iron transport system substrate-binding protein|nr:manganese/iron transport system substrate-binding protein [Chloroflexota bacterium]